MNSNEIKKFLESIRDTDIEEMEFETDDTSVYLKKSEVTVKQPVIEEKVAVKKSPIVPIKSNMVGTFYSSPSNDRPPFVVEGTRVEVGQKIGTIEAMRVNKDVIATTSGKVVKVCIQNGQTVEYGQELFLVDTSDVK
ncbi:acetyl-CoA carboxylase biotin carboxyl carrier protein [Candidatus Ruminimicrobium bovinum]|uniref:acetyl-CoA carboxylase biotin carboxyl carrier protein n=1 Tax=Candidatus Ruminimicrobium bovinum TaxID=3242779 RepID=UPI0039B988E0